ncbi:MAG TPA: hypothetical protein VGK67_33210 [Myxococcales bacterium]|jgi:hypothetical protein
MQRSSALSASVLAALALSSVPARAQQESESSAATSPAAAEGAAPPSTAAATAGEPKAEPLGLALDLGASSAYVLRGYNMFQKSSQWDPHAFLAPSITWTAGKTGLSIGYWGAYQFLGDNIGPVIDAGMGAENDLILSFSREMAPGVVAGAAFTAYLYPAAKKAVAGTDFPVYLEPALFVNLSTVVDVGLRVTYYHGVQDAIAPYRYVYLNPTVGKTLVLSERISLALSGSVGLKLFPDPSTPVSQMNRYDVLVGAALPIAVVGPLYLKPSISWAWTDLPTAPFKDEMVVFGGVNVGATL